MRLKHPYDLSSLSSFAALKRILGGIAAASLLLATCAHAAGPTRTTLAAAAGDGTASSTDSASSTSTAPSSDTVLTATVTTAIGAPVASGTVDFLLPSGASVGSAIVAANGTAVLKLDKIPAAPGATQTSVTAAYKSGDTANGNSASAPLALAAPAVTTVLPDFTVTGNPTTVTTPQGSFGTTAITVTSVGGYNGSIEFSCTGLPAQVTCAFNPTQQLLGANNTFVSTLELQTQGPSGTQSSLLTHGTGIALALVLPGALLLTGLTRRRRGVQWFSLGLLLVTAGFGLSGCSQRYGYLHHPPPVAGGSPIGTFPITVAVTGGQGATITEHDIIVSLVVQ